MEITVPFKLKLPHISLSKQAGVDLFVPSINLQQLAQQRMRARRSKVCDPPFALTI